MSGLISQQMRHQLLLAEPKPITRYDMISHMKEADHTLVNVPDELKCPIYIENGKRTDFLFNTYLCKCGRIYIFLASIQRAGITVDSKGMCPCDTCRYFKNGCTVPP